MEVVSELHGNDVKWGHFEDSEEAEEGLHKVGLKSMIPDYLTTGMSNQVWFTWLDVTIFVIVVGERMMCHNMLLEPRKLVETYGVCRQEEEQVVNKPRPGYTAVAGIVHDVGTH